MTNFAPINGLSINTARKTETDTAYTNFLADPKQPAVFFLDLTYRSRNELDPLSTPPAGQNVLPINVTRASPLFTPNDDQMFFVSKNWIGRPSDPLRPNQAPKRRLIAAFRIRRSTPYFPNEDSRIQTTIANATLSNPDGDLNFLAVQQTTEGYRAPIWHGPLDGDFGQMQRIVQPLVRGVETNGKQLIIQFGTASTSFSGIYLQRARFDGSGGINGDLSLKGTLKPMLFGSVFCIEPALIYAAQLIYMVNAGPTSGIGPVWDGGAAIPFDRDYPTFESLAAATITPGHYATCLAAGCFRMQIPPLHALRCSVRGDVSGGVYRQDAGQILLHVLTTMTGRPTSLFNISSFGQLSKSPIGWYNERRDYTVEDFINLILRPENAVLGETVTGLIGVIKHRPPRNQSAARTLRPRPSQVEVRLLDYVPYSSQTVRYGRNWAPMSESDFASGVGDVERQPFRDEWQTVRETSGLISGFSNVGSQAGTKDTWWARDESAAAQAQASEDIQMFGRATVGLTIRGLGRQAFGIRDGEVINLVVDKFGFESGRNIVVVGVDQSARGEIVDLEAVV